MRHQTTDIESNLGLVGLTHSFTRRLIRQVVVLKVIQPASTHADPHFAAFAFQCEAGLAPAKPLPDIQYRAGVDAAFVVAVCLSKA